MEREDDEIPPPYDGCGIRFVHEEPVDAPPEYVNPKQKSPVMRLLSWFWKKVSRDSCENERPPKYMIEIRDFYGNLIEIDPDSRWEVVAESDYSDD